MDWVAHISPVETDGIFWFSLNFPMVAASNKNNNNNNCNSNDIHPQDQLNEIASALIPT